MYALVGKQNLYSKLMTSSLSSLPSFLQVNVANLTLGRQDADLALCLMSVDGEVPAAAVEQLKALAQLNDVRTAKLGGHA